MRWFLAGCCGLVLIHVSVALQISQKPRFYGVRTNQPFVMVYCRSSKQHLPASVKWYKAATHTSYQNELKGNRYEYFNKSLTVKAFLKIKNLTTEDSGVYFCKINETNGPGTHIKVVRTTNRETAEYRSKMKDGLIVLQGLLLAVCIAAIILRKQQLLEKRDSIYEEPETDHIYEGLAIETCGGGLYEELTVYAQAELAEAPWE